LRAPGLAYTTMIPKSSPATQAESSVFRIQERPTSVAKPSQENLPDLAQAESHRMSLITEVLNKYALSPAVKDVLMASWREGTSKQYRKIPKISSSVYKPFRI